MKILGIESSCDEAGVAVFDSQQGISCNLLHSQIKLHQDYGGVVPELAARDHVRMLPTLLRQALDKFPAKELDAIAYTAGPGLVGCLLVGASLAQGLAYAHDLPAIAVHHMEGHLLAPMLESRQPKMPFIALLVSGGHTLLVEVTAIGAYKILGESIDDAAGEAFDKTAKLLGLPYPGGPQLAKLATQGDATRFDFPRPLTQKPGLDFSFSGLKTHVRLKIEQHAKTEQDKADIAACFEDAVVDTLAIKCERALKQCGLKDLVIAGGVSANIKLRQKLEALMQKLGGEVFYPRPEFCTDNGAMIAYAGFHRFHKDAGRDRKIIVKPRWDLDGIA